MKTKSKSKPAPPRHILVETLAILGSARAALGKISLITESRRELSELIYAAETNLDVFMKANGLPPGRRPLQSRRIPADWCNCRTVHSWHGNGHASQCPCVVATWR